MSYEPQPGTIPHKAIAWLRSMARVNPLHKPSTPEICEALDIDSVGFTAYMAPARRHGIVRAWHQSGTKVLLWGLGDGTPVDLEVREKDEPLHERAAVDLTGVRGPLLPTPAPTPPLRTLEWDGNLLVTGMEIRDGVAIFSREQAMQLRQQLAWSPL